MEADRDRVEVLVNRIGRLLGRQRRELTAVPAEYRRKELLVLPVMVAVLAVTVPRVVLGKILPLLLRHLLRILSRHRILGAIYVIFEHILLKGHLYVCHQGHVWISFERILLSSELVADTRMRGCE